MHERGEDDMVFPSCVHHSRHSGLRCARAFQLNLQNDFAIDQRKSFVQCWHALATASVKLTDFCAGKFCNFARPVSCPISSRVVHQNQMAIYSELDIDFNLIDAKGNCSPYRTEGVFWFKRTSPTVRGNNHVLAYTRCHCTRVTSSWSSHATVTASPIFTS